MPANGWFVLAEERSNEWCNRCQSGRAHRTRAANHLRAHIWRNRNSEADKHRLLERTPRLPYGPYVLRIASGAAVSPLHKVQLALFYREYFFVIFVWLNRNDKQVVGGESLFLDAFLAAYQFRQKYPEHFHVLTKVPATFQKIHFKRERPVCMIYKRPHIELNHRNEIIAVNWSPAFEGPLCNVTEVWSRCWVIKIN